MTSAIDGGRILNTKTARSQVTVGGIGMALLEETVTDPGTGRITNATLADYLVPVNADIPDLDVLFVGESDRFNPIGVKGVGEMGLMASPPPSPTPYFTPPAGASGPCHHHRAAPLTSTPNYRAQPPRHWRGGEAGRMAASTPGMRWLTGSGVVGAVGRVFGLACSLCNYLAEAITAQLACRRQNLCWRLNHPGPEYVTHWTRRKGGWFPGGQEPGPERGGIPMMRFPSIPVGGARRSVWSAATIVAAGTLVTVALGAAPASAHTSAYRQINLVSDQPGKAPLTDPDLVNAWGLAASPGTDAAPGSPLWVADNGSDKATLYTGATPTSVSKASLVVSVTGAAPTGQVFNADQSAFVVRDNQGHSGSSVFLFDTENGTIDGWSPTVGAVGGGPSTVTEVARDNGANAVYKGLAIAQASGGKTFLYATNFRSGRVEAYDSTFKPVELPGGLFVDPRLPAGYGPFGIAELNGKLYVTFAKQDATLHDDVAGPGHGFVDVFTNDGAFVRRLVTRGALDSPWGLATAPAGFGQFSGDLLVGNFGNGHINVYNPVTGAHLGQLRRPNGQPIVIDGLWGLQFGNGNAAKTSELVFSAGPDGEAHGLLGKIVVKH